MSRVVLDSSAVLAVFLQEKGAERVMEVIARAICCTPNVTEIVTRLIDVGRTPEDAEADFRRARIAVEPFDRDLALVAGRLRAATKHRGLSLGDRACLALALRERASVMTADKPWRGLDVGVEIELIR